MSLATIPPPCATHSRTRAPRICMHGENLVNVTGENTVNPVCNTGHKGGVTKGLYMCRLAYREEPPSEFRGPQTASMRSSTAAEQRAAAQLAQWQGCHRGV